MECRWEVLVVVFLLNTLYVALIFLAQQVDKSLPPRHSIIPGTNQKFLYMQDFYTMTWGDLIGLSFIGNAFVHLVVYGQVGVWHWLVFAVLAVVFAVVYLVMWLGPNHKPDIGFPKAGKIGLQGIVHQPYFGFYMALSVLCIWFIFTGSLNGVVLYVGLVGALFYLVCHEADKLTGNFDALKPI